MSLARTLAWPLYPIALAGAVIVDSYSSFTAPIVAVWRPLGVLLVAVMLVQAAMTLVLRDRYRGALLASLVLLLIAGVVPIALGASLALLAVIAWSTARGSSLGALPWSRATALLNAVTALTLIMVTGSVVTAGHASPTGQSPMDAVMPGLGAPDIYVVVLDAYPRADTLATHFGIDNSAFITGMEELGFEHVANSRSNYNMTLLTLTSMLDMGYIPKELTDHPPDDTVSQYRVLQGLMDNASGLAVLRQHGYEIVTIPSTSTTTRLGAADRHLETGAIIDFELTLLQSGSTRYLLPDVQRQLVTDSHRDGLPRAFSLLKSLGREQAQGPASCSRT